MKSHPQHGGLAAAGLALALAVSPAHAASHREAPLMTLDPAADITDVYFFTSYDAANLGRTGGDRRVTMILNAVPGQEPGSGPNYFAFDDDVLYELHVDNDQDGSAEDVRYQVRFQTEQRSPDQFVATLGGGPLGERIVKRLRRLGSDVRHWLCAVEPPARRSSMPASSEARLGLKIGRRRMNPWSPMEYKPPCPLDLGQARHPHDARQPSSLSAGDQTSVDAKGPRRATACPLFLVWLPYPLF